MESAERSVVVERYKADKTDPKISSASSSRSSQDYEKTLVDDLEKKQNDEKIEKIRLKLLSDLISNLKFIVEIENEHLAIHEKVDKASGVHKPEGLFMSSRACSPAKNLSAGVSLDFSSF